jgi:hypothetical protein
MPMQRIDHIIQSSLLSKPKGLEPKFSFRYRIMFFRQQKRFYIHSYITISTANYGFLHKGSRAWNRCREKKEAEMKYPIYMVNFHPISVASSHKNFYF